MSHNSPITNIVTDSSTVSPVDKTYKFSIRKEKSIELWFVRCRGQKNY